MAAALYLAFSELALQLGRRCPVRHGVVAALLQGARSAFSSLLPPREGLRLGERLGDLHWMMGGTGHKAVGEEGGSDWREMLNGGLGGPARGSVHGWATWGLHSGHSKSSRDWEERRSHSAPPADFARPAGQGGRPGGRGLPHRTASCCCQSALPELCPECRRGCACQAHLLGLRLGERSSVHFHCRAEGYATMEERRGRETRRQSERCAERSAACEAQCMQLMHVSAAPSYAKELVVLRAGGWMHGTHGQASKGSGPTHDCHVARDKQRPPPSPPSPSACLLGCPVHLPAGAVHAQAVQLLPGPLSIAGAAPGKAGWGRGRA